MKLKSILLVAMAVASVPAFAHFETYYGVLSGTNEVPANSSPATGWARVTLDLDLFTMRVEAQFSGLTGNTTASHIHAGNGPGTNGGVVTALPSFPGFPLGVTSGTYDNTFDMALASSYNPSYITNNGGTVSSAFNAFRSKLLLGHAYYNIHTTTYGGGELRANLQAVPEPGTMIAVGAGLAGIVARKRRKKA